LRDKAGYSCKFVASALKPEHRDRDRISKLSAGASGIDQYGYLQLMWFYCHEAPGHPAVTLAKRLLPCAALTGGGSTGG